MNFLSLNEFLELLLKPGKRDRVTSKTYFREYAFPRGWRTIMARVDAIEPVNGARWSVR